MTRPGFGEPAMSKKKSVTNPALQSWVSLNDTVMNLTDEDELKKLLREELKGRKRKKFAERIHSRINKLRAEREREELAAAISEDTK
jgi:hypothetical protein